ncbi:MAG: septum formation initiator family protein [Gammaproteobacteria bacterium]|jgi:cell division protein FtsB
MRFLIFVLIILLFFLQYKFWGFHGGLANTWRLHRAVNAQQKSNKNLIKRNQELARQVYRLKHAKDSVELLAREKLGMVKKGEQYYRVVDK